MESFLQISGILGSEAQALGTLLTQQDLNMVPAAAKAVSRQPSGDRKPRNARGRWWLHEEAATQAGKAD